MERDTLLHSKKNLKRLLRKIQKYPKTRDKEDVDTAVNSLDFYHCIRQENILQVLNDKKIQIKRQIIHAKLTNNSSDFYQGFDKYLSMSIGKPWTEYGPFAFVFGLDKISPNALFFFKDPYKWDAQGLYNNVLVKKDVITLSKELLSRNLLFINKRTIIKAPYKKDLFNLARYNLRRFEVKQPGALKIQDAVEFIAYSGFEKFARTFNRIFYNPIILAMFVILAIVLWLQARGIL